MEFASKQSNKRRIVAFPFVLLSQSDNEKEFSLTQVQTYVIFIYILDREVLGMKQSQRDREGVVDALKGVCILLVCFTHFSWTSTERTTFLFPWWVDMAVPVFMVLSGYVYEKAVLNKKMYSLTQVYTPDVLLKKIIRFSIPVLIVYAATLALDKKTYGQIPYGIFMTFLQGGRGPGSYYYPVMIQTVFVLPVIETIIRKHEEKGLLLCLVANIIYEVLHIAYYIPVESYRLLMFRYIFVLASGCFIARGRPVKPYIPVSMFCVGVAFLCAHLYGGYQPLFITHWTGTSFVAAMYIIPIAWLTLRTYKVRFPLLELVGKASYNIYLTQMLYYYTISNSLFQNIGSRKIQLLVSMLICVCSGILFYYAETPLTKYVQRRIGALLSKE